MTRRPNIRDVKTPVNSPAARIIRYSGAYSMRSIAFSFRLSAFTIFILIVNAVNAKKGARNSAFSSGFAGESTAHAAAKGSATKSNSLTKAVAETYNSPFTPYS